MARVDNIKVFEEGMKKAAQLAASMLADKSYAPMMGVVNTAEQDRGWTGFTGNAQTSYGASCMTKTEFRQYRADDHNGPVVCDKVKRGETVYLEEPYEGEPREVSGAVDIRFANSTQALDYILDLPMPPTCLANVRIAFPLEYVNYLREHYANGGENPLAFMHQLSSVAFRGIK